MSGFAELAVVGAGPAGVAAALYARARGVAVTVFDPEPVGGLVAKASLVSHYPALLAGESGPQFGARMALQLDAAGVSLVPALVQCVNRIDEGFELCAGGKSYRARAVVLACGSRPRVPAVEGLTGTINHFARQVATPAGRACLMLGGGDGAAKEALNLLSRGAKSLYMVFPEPALPCIAEFAVPLKSDKRVTFYPGSTLKRVNGEPLTDATVETPEGQQTLRCSDGMVLVVCAGQTPCDEVSAPLLGEGFISAGEDCVTAVDGLWVAGDLRAKKLRQAATAAADGAVAGVAAALWIKNRAAS